MLNLPLTKSDSFLCLQTLNSISAEKNSTVIFPLPMDILNQYLDKKAAKEEAAKLSNKYKVKLVKSKEE